MAMGTALHKGNNSSNKGKSYGVLVLLAFGAALLGVMVIHKLRERRIFNLLVQEKDRDLISLHLLLQKEREYNKEMKKRAEEMKAKIYTLRTQKMENDRKILELQSTIDGLKDERKVMESALEEKLNQIKMNRETSFDSDMGNHEVIALTESLKQKESEIDDLKRQLEKNPYKVWSVSTDDPSNSQMNSNVTTSLADKNKTVVEESEAKEGQLQESTNYSNGVDAARDNGSGDESTTFMKMSDNSFDGHGNKDPENKKETSQDNGASGAGEVNNIVNANESSNGTLRKVTQSEDAYKDEKVAVSQEHKAAGDELQGLGDAQQEGAQNQVTFKGGVKLEITDNASSSSSSRVKGKHTKGRRWRMIAQNRRLENNRNSENNGAVLRTRKFFHNDQEKPVYREAATVSTNGKELELVKNGNNPLKGTTLKGIREEDLSSAKLLEPLNPEDSEYLKNQHVRYDTSSHNKVSQDGQLLSKGSFDGKATEPQSQSEKQSSVEEIQQHEGQKNNGTSNNGAASIQNIAEQGNAAAVSKREMADEIEPENINHETDEDSVDFNSSSISDMNEEEEEYKEETDEFEF